MISIIDNLEKWAKQQPNVIVYKNDTAELTYRQLYDFTRLYGELLKKQGDGPVMIIGHKDVDFFVSIFSCIYANRTYIPVDISIPKKRIESILEISNSKLIITKYSGYKFGNSETLNLNQLLTYSKCDYFENENDIAYYIFTSGSTGSPKGVQITYSNLNNFIEWIGKLNKKKHLNVLNQALFSFDLSVADIFFSVCYGHTLFALEKAGAFDGEYIFNNIKSNNINYIVATPTFLKLCLMNNNFSNHYLSSVELIYLCGEMLNPATARKIINRFSDVKLMNAYGPTEATSAVSMTQITPDMLNNTVLPVGDAKSFATEIEIEDGEIVLKGKSVFCGYLDNDSCKYHSENGINCFKTGDLGEIKNGKLYCFGRKDRQIKINGYRIELGEIERAILEIDSVDNCFVKQVNDESGNVKYLIATVSGKVNSKQMLVKELRKSLPEYMIPKHFEFKEDFSYNENYKAKG